MLRSLLLVSLLAAPALSSASELEQAERFGYEHIHLNIGAGTTDKEWLENSNVTTMVLGGNYLYTNNWLFNFDYTAQFFHPDTYTLRIDRLTFGGGYRYGLAPQFDMYGLYRLGAIKAKATDNDTDKALVSDTDFIHAAVIGASYLLRENFIVTAEAEANRSDIVDENKITVGFNYQWHDVIGTGLYYQYRDTDYAGASSDYINEVGLSLKFLY